MNKCKLQELCQRHGWALPEYSTLKVGPCHMPRFTATVTVKDDVFETPLECRSAKEAQNTVAQIAFDHFDAPPVATVVSLNSIAAATPFFPIPPPPSNLPIPSAGLFGVKNDANSRHANMETLQHNHGETSQSSLVYRDNIHVYKNRLQQYAQKQNLGFPVYTCEAKGPPHSRCFKSSVSLGGKSYETPDFFTTLKEAEQAAAKIACQILSADAIQEDGGLCKNLLQEFAQKMGLSCPSYETVRYGMSHIPVFISTVKIGTDTVLGTEAKTKKQAEMNAAKVAYYALTEGCSVNESSEMSSTNGRVLADHLKQNIHTTAIIKQHQVTTIDEEVQNAEKAKSSHRKMIVNSSVPSQNDSALDKSSSHSSPLKCPLFVDEQPIDGNISTKSRTVVFPRSLNWPILARASVKPYSDDRWIAFKVPASTA